MRYAITATITGIELQVAGLILMVVGAVWLIIGLLQQELLRQHGRQTRQHIDAALPGAP